MRDQKNDGALVYRDHQSFGAASFPEQNDLLKNCVVYAFLLVSYTSAIHLIFLIGLMPTLFSYSPVFAYGMILVDAFFVLLIQRTLARQVWKRHCFAPFTHT